MQNWFLFITLIVVMISLGRGNFGESYRLPLEVLRDPAGELSLDENLDTGTTLDFLTVSGQGFTGGFTRDTFSFRFEIKPFKRPTNQVFLDIHPPYLGNVQLFVPDTNDGYLTFLARDIYPLLDRLLAYGGPALFIPNPKTALTAYNGLQSDSTSAMFLTAWTPYEFYEASLLECIMFGGYIGLLLIFIAFNLSRSAGT